MENAYGYIRVNSLKKFEKIYQAKIKNYCKQNKLKLIDIFKDEGFNKLYKDKFGRFYEEETDSREGLGNLINNIENGEIKKIVVFNSFMLWENVFEESYVKRKLKKAKVEILSIEEPNFSLYQKKPIDEFFDNVTIALQREKARKNMIEYY